MPSPTCAMQSWQQQETRDASPGWTARKCADDVGSSEQAQCHSPEPQLHSQVETSVSASFPRGGSGDATRFRALPFFSSDLFASPSFADPAFASEFSFPAFHDGPLFLP